MQWNFPYHATFAFPERFHLLRASLNNIGHFLFSQLSMFRSQHRPAVVELFARYDRIILLATSCGLELLRNLQLPAEVRQRVHVFACGPVSLGLPEVASCLMIQGEDDVISRCFHWRVRHRFPCSHMGYLLAPETLRLFDQFCREALGDAPAETSATP